jgi:ATP-binding cassette subfamily B protein
MLVGGFVAMLQYVQRLKTGFDNVFLPYNGYNAAMGQIERIIEIFHTEPEYISTKLIKSFAIRGEIIFENVTFGYDKKVNILKSVNIKINSGESVFLFGPSGSGKTTFIKLLFRYIKPQKGTIYMDGIDIQKINLEEYRKNIGLVLQESRFFSGTVLENLCYGLDKIDLEEVYKVAEMVNIHNEILQMENGYDTHISSIQTQLSIGQRQRITLARVILRNPPLLILDEVTNALDVENDFKIKKILKKVVHNRTSIIISHDLKSTYITDKYFMIGNKKIHEIPNSYIKSLSSQYSYENK